MYVIKSHRGVIPFRMFESFVRERERDIYMERYEDIDIKLLTILFLNDFKIVFLAEFRPFV